MKDYKGEERNVIIVKERKWKWERKVYEEDQRNRGGKDKGID